MRLPYPRYGMSSCGLVASSTPGEFAGALQVAADLLRRASQPVSPVWHGQIMCAGCAGSVCTRLAPWPNFESTAATQSYDRMLSLAAIANWETAVLASIAGATGTPDERDAQITRSGLYAEYPAIVSAYLELLRLRERSGDCDRSLQAAGVSRAGTRLANHQSSPGISELPESSVREIMRELDTAIVAGRIDDELRMMLARYDAVFGYVFEHFGPVRGLATLVAGVSAAEMPPAGRIGATVRRSGPARHVLAASVGIHGRLIRARSRTPSPACSARPGPAAAD